MATRRRTVFDGLPREASDQLVAVQDGLAQATADLRQETVGRTTETKTAAYSAGFNEAIRVQMPAAGGSLTFPGASVGTVDKWIEVIVLGGGAVKVQPTSGQIDGVSSVSLTQAGRYMFRSDGLSSWWRATGGPPALGSVTLPMLEPIAPNTVVANDTAGPASPTAIAVSSESVLGRTSGNLQAIASAVQTALIRAAGSVFWAGAAANQVLRRVAAGDLGFGLLADGNMTANTLTGASQAQMAANTLKGNPTAALANESDLAVGVNTVVGRQGGNVVAAQLVAGQVAANTLTAGTQAQMAANSLKGNATAGVANEADQALAVQSILLRAAANIVNAAAAADQVLGRVGSGDLGFVPTPRLLRAPQVLTSGTSINHTAGTRVLVVRGVGGGGAGGGVNAAAGALGAQGGSATYGEKTFLAPASSSTYAIGAAGAGVSGAAGTNGGSSTFTNGATTVTLPGGNGGNVAAGSAAAATTAAGGGPSTAATNADWSIPGEGGADALKPQVATTPCFHLGPAGSNPLGAGARAKATLTTINAGSAGAGFGAGGNGALQGTSVAAAAGQAGTAGAWIVEEWG